MSEDCIEVRTSVRSRGHEGCRRAGLIPNICLVMEILLTTLTLNVETFIRFLQEKQLLLNSISSTNIAFSLFYENKVVLVCSG